MSGTKPMNTARLTPWLRLVLPYALFFMLVQCATRIGLLVYSGQWSAMTAPEIAGIFGWGFLFDIQVMGFALLPLLALHAVPSPVRWAERRWRITRTVLFFLFAYIWLFTAISEFFFWDEFGTRFNFIAVDYLVYTTEVIGNIRESYPLGPLLGGIALTAALATLAAHRWLRLDTHGTQTSRGYALAIMALPFLMLPLLNIDRVQLSANQAVQELATNGTYDLFSAYRNNEINYRQLYITHDETRVAGKMRELLEEDENEFVNTDPNDITRLIVRKGPELRKNVVLVVMESMSADFMRTFGNTGDLTPNLDGLTNEALFFSDMYATGTRTVRGLEAITLSVPPTPGQSILRRPGNENLFSLGFVFQDRGYDTAFIYGGHGYFDNMNAFFSQNGYRIVDRTDFKDDEVGFSNVWGVSDEDLYNQVIRQADRAYAAKQPFMYEVMTTSNHRPYTYPDGRIDIPSGVGKRSGGVKYADYAVGRFLADAKDKPWFRDTIFVFVADHTAGAGGKIELSQKKYHIPAIFYAPGFIKPQNYNLTASQIDVAPVLLGLLNFSYYTKFYGEDLLNDADEAENAHAFISNYQKVAYLEKGQLTVLEPLEKTAFFEGEETMPANRVDNTLLIDTVTFYQFASGWKDRMKRIPTVYKKR